MPEAWKQENPNPFGDRFETGVTSRYGGVVHAVMLGVPAQQHWVRAQCGQWAERGVPNPARRGNAPSVCQQCTNAVWMTNTLIERYDARTGQ